MAIEPARLRFLLAIARSGGVLAAADELGVTPSAVSQQLARLEQEAGRPLVQRTPRGAVLTDAGWAVAHAAEEVERALNLLHARLAEGEADPIGTVRVGGVQSFLRSVLVPSLTAWREKFPRLRFEVIECVADDSMRLLRTGELDLVIVELDAGQRSARLPSGMIETPLLDEPWMLVVPQNSLVSAETLDLENLPLPWLGVDDSVASAQALRRVRRAFAAAESAAHRYQETQTALALVAAGEGVALIPSLALRGVPQAGVQAVAVPGLGMRRIVLRRYERRDTPEHVAVAAGLVRDAAGTFELLAHDTDEVSPAP